MIRIIFYTLLFISAITAGSTDVCANTWKYFASSNESNFYYDSKTIISVTKNTATVRVREIPIQADRSASGRATKKGKSSGQERNYIMTHNEIDCSSREFRVLETIEVRAGKQVSYLKTAESSFEKIPSESVIEHIYKIVCKKRR